MTQIVSWVPTIAPPLFIYFDVLGGYLGFNSRAMNVAINGAAGEAFGQVIWNFMTNSKTNLFHVFKCAASYGAGAFIGVQYILPMTGMTPSPPVYTLAAMLGGHVLKWLLGFFGDM